MGKVMLEVRELTTKYITRFREDVYAVDHVSLKVEEGKSLGIAGESGCGKSTLALSLMLLIDWLQRRNRQLRVSFEDINSPQFDPAGYGLTREQVMGAIHGVLADGTVIRGMEVIRRAYAAVGLGWIMAPTAWPGMRQLTDRLYALFARYRVPMGRLFGRKVCDAEAGTCER